MCVSIVWLVVNVLDMSIHICVHRCEYTSVHYAYICPAHLCTIHVCVCVSAPALCKTCMPSSMVVCPGPGWCPGVRDTATPVNPVVLSQAHCGVIRPGSFVPSSPSLATIASAQARAVTRNTLEAVKIQELGTWGE